MRIKAFLFVSIFLFGNFALKAQPDSVSLDAAIPAHPRILMLPADEAAIKANIENDTHWKNIHQIIIDGCDKIIPMPTLQRVQVGKRILPTAREFLRRIFFLSYAWRITKEEKYLKKAEAEMLAVSAFTDWNPSHFLDVAEMTLGLSIGYDWTYNNLPAQSRAIIEEAILKKGIEQSLDRKYNGWQYGTNNWNQVCNTGMSYGAMAIFEKNPVLSAFVVNRAIKSIPISMHEAYAPDGAYPEGYAYWSYGTSFNVLLISALEKMFGKDFGLSQKEGFLKTAGYMISMTGATGKAFNYSDSPPVWEPLPAMVWFANKQNDPSLLWIERNQIEADKKNTMQKERLFPAFMVWGAGLRLNKIKPPAEKMYVGAGANPVAMMRTSWKDPNAIYVGLKTGSPNFSHAHMDIGSFIMEADGVRWAMDFGPQGYETLEAKNVDLWNYKQNSQRWEVYRYNNFVHNTLTVNDSLQIFNGKAIITSHSNTAKFMNATTDLTGLYKNGLEKANRGIAIVDKKYVAVKDEVETGAKEATVTWTMLTPADVTIVDKNKAELKKDGKKLILLVSTPATVSLVTQATTPTHDYDQANLGTTLIKISVKVPANTKQDITVLLLPEKAVKKAKSIKPLAEWPQ